MVAGYNDAPLGNSLPHLLGLDSLPFRYLFHFRRDFSLKRLTQLGHEIPFSALMVPVKTSPYICTVFLWNKKKSMPNSAWTFPSSMNTSQQPQGLCSYISRQVSWLPAWIVRTSLPACLAPGGRRTVDTRWTTGYSGGTARDSHPVPYSPLRAPWKCSIP